MDAFQNLITLDIQVAAILVSNIIGGMSLSNMCPVYTYISYYLTFMQAMFLIKVNTSLDATQVWWFNALWCIVLDSYIASILFGIVEFMIQAEYTITRKCVINILKSLYFILFLVTSIIFLTICDPDKC